MDRYDPFDAMDRMFDQMRRSMLDARMDAGSRTDARPMGLPAAEGTDLDVRGDRSRGELTSFGETHLRIERTDDGFVAIADLPGFEREEITVAIDDGLLTVEAVHEASEEDDLSVRRHTRRLTESARLPETVDLDAVDATYRNGVLEISLPTTVALDDDARTIDIN